MKITIEIDEQHAHFKRVPAQTVTEILEHVARAISRGMVHGSSMDLDAQNVCTWAVEFEKKG